MSYLRFVAHERHWPRRAMCVRSRTITHGPFWVAYAYARDTRQPAYYRRALDEHLDWFGEHLPVPDRLWSRFGRTSYGVGVCWFKAGARRHIARMRDMCVVLNELGHPVASRWTADPGQALYQDDFQIVAVERTEQVHMYW